MQSAEEGSCLSMLRMTTGIRMETLAFLSTNDDSEERIASGD